MAFIAPSFPISVAAVVVLLEKQKEGWQECEGRVLEQVGKSARRCAPHNAMPNDQQSRDHLWTTPKIPDNVCYVCQKTYMPND